MFFGGGRLGGVGVLQRKPQKAFGCSSVVLDETTFIKHILYIYHHISYIYICILFTATCCQNVSFLNIEMSSINKPPDAFLREQSTIINHHRFVWQVLTSWGAFLSTVAWGQTGQQFSSRLCGCCACWMDGWSSWGSGVRLLCRRFFSFSLWHLFNAVDGYNPRKLRCHLKKEPFWKERQHHVTSKHASTQSNWELKDEPKTIQRIVLWNCWL